MKTKISDFCRIFAGLALFLYASSGVADQAPNPRSAVAMNSGTARSGGAVVSRGNGKSGAVVSRSAIVKPADIKLIIVTNPFKYFAHINTSYVA